MPRRKMGAAVLKTFSSWEISDALLLIAAGRCLMMFGGGWLDRVLMSQWLVVWFYVRVVLSVD